MERKLIANSLVPDNEVWVSPKTWDSPFTQSKVAQNSTDIQQIKDSISLQQAALKNISYTISGGDIYAARKQLMDSIAKLESLD